MNFGKWVSGYDGDFEPDFAKHHTLPFRSSGNGLRATGYGLQETGYGLDSNAAFFYSSRS
jgi:hypothetical protein